MVAIYRFMSPAQKFELMSVINDFVVKCIRANICRDHPGWSHDKVSLEVIRMLHGNTVNLEGIARSLQIQHDQSVKRDIDS